MQRKNDARQCNAKLNDVVRSKHSQIKLQNGRLRLHLLYRTSVYELGATLDSTIPKREPPTSELGVAVEEKSSTSLGINQFQVDLSSPLPI